MKTNLTLLATLAFGFMTQSFAQQAEHPLGEHPAVIVKRQEAHQTYDYQAQFYPHPAWLYLSTDAPHPMMDHPAVIVARREREEARAHTTISTAAVLDANVH